MKAFILCGGRGTRMGEARDKSIPKPLVNVHGKPIIFWNIASLVRSGIRNFTIATGFEGNKLVEYLSSKKFLNELISLLGINEKINLSFSDAGENANTGERLNFFFQSSIKHKQPILYFYGDTIILKNISDYLLGIKDNHPSILVDKLKSKYGIIKINKGQVIYFGENESRDYINRGGIFISEKVIKLFTKDNYKSFEKDFLPKVIINEKFKTYDLDGHSISFNTKNEIFEFQKKIIKFDFMNMIRNFAT